MKFFDTIIAIANERPLTADDFRPFIGEKNWLEWNGAIFSFTIWGIVGAGIESDDIIIDIPGLRKIQINADELAIRMEAA